MFDVRTAAVRVVSTVVLLTRPPILGPKKPVKESSNHIVAVGRLNYATIPVLFRVFKGPKYFSPLSGSYLTHFLIYSIIYYLCQVPTASTTLPFGEMVCANCGIRPRAYQRTLCSRCKWERVAGSMKQHRRSPIHRAKQKDYHYRNRAAAEAYLLDLLGKDGKFVCSCGHASVVKREFSFHHIIPSVKTGTFSQFLRRGNYATKLKLEQVQLLCENCHRDTWSSNKNQNKIAVKTELINQVYGKQECHDCKRTWKLHQLDFHHREESTKVFGIASRLSWKHFDKLVIEAQKCDLLCACCHQRRHSR
jgi:hypothetical protein